MAKTETSTKPDEKKESSTTSSPAPERVAVRLKVKRIPDKEGAYGFIDPKTRVVKVLHGLLWQMGEQHVRKSVWDAAEEYKP